MSFFVLEEPVAIDTNVFVDLSNKHKNVDGHITRLLGYILQLKTPLLVDSGGRISGEYNVQLSQTLQNSDDERTELLLLRYWILMAPRIEIQVQRNDDLMRVISKIVIEQSETVDRTFVYVALSKGAILVSNDELHIVFGNTKERSLSPRRRRLLKDSKRYCPSGAEILTSLEAHSKI